MTLILNLPPERETALKAQAQAQGVSAEEYALQVLERDLKPAGLTRRHISERIVERMSKVPPDIMATMPADGASQHDHYLYGHPKRDL